MNYASPLAAAQSYNAALEHPTVAVAMRHLARKTRSFRASDLVEHLSGLETFPEALTRLFTGENFGKLVLEVAAD